MPPMAKDLKLNLFIITLLSFSISLLIFTSTLHLKTYPSAIQDQAIKGLDYSNRFPPFYFLQQDLGEKEIRIGLINVHAQEAVEKWKSLGTTTTINFNRVPKAQRWQDYFPEWIDQEEEWDAPKCPEIPMPTDYENYIELNLLVVKMPCGDKRKGKGVRDVFRLQVNLVVANLVVHTGDEENLLVLFIGSCGPMFEIFRCEDLVRHEEEFWIYRPDVKRLKQKILLPVGSCQLAVPHIKQGGGKVVYDFSKLSNPIDHPKPKEAYVTVLHSSEAYVCGAIALAQSILQTNSTKDLVLLVDRSITKKSQQALSIIGWKVKYIKRIRNPRAVKHTYNEWNYSKLRIWQLTEYDKVIFIDSDIIFLKNIDKFFACPQLSVVGNNKVLFNSGVMLIEPSHCVFKMLMKEMYNLVSYNGGDQGFLNEVFTWWHRWPARLNFLKMYEGVDDEAHTVPEPVYAIHYLGLKPWMCYRDYDCNWDKLDHQPYASDSAHWRWWEVYDAMPKRLHAFCAITPSRDTRIWKWRKRAENASLPDRHWKIKIKDHRQFRCKHGYCGM